MNISQHLAKGRRRSSDAWRYYNRCAYRHLLHEIREDLRMASAPILTISPCYTIRFSYYSFDRRYDAYTMAGALRLYCRRHPGATYKEHLSSDNHFYWTLDLSGCSESINPLKP